MILECNVDESVDRTDLGLASLHLQLNKVVNVCVSDKVLDLLVSEVGTLTVLLGLAHTGLLLLQILF